MGGRLLFLTHVTDVFVFVFENFYTTKLVLWIYGAGEGSACRVY